MVKATFLDGATKDIKVRQLPVRLLEQLDVKQSDEPALVELYCDQEKGWADTLTHETYEQIASLGDEINRAPFERLTARMVERVGLVKSTRRTLVDAGVLTDPTPQKPRPGELLILPEVRPAPLVPEAPAATAAPASKTPSAPSVPADSSPQTEGH